MADHAQLANLAHLTRQALVDGDLGIANEQCARIARLFAVHGKEEEGLFAELRLDPIATEAVEDLEAEQRRAHGPPPLDTVHVSRCPRQPPSW